MTRRARAREGQVAKVYPPVYVTRRARACDDYPRKTEVVKIRSPSCERLREIAQTVESKTPRAENLT